MPRRPHRAVKLASQVPLSLSSFSPHQCISTDQPRSPRSQATPDTLLDKSRDSYGAAKSKAKHVEVPWRSQTCVHPPTVLGRRDEALTLARSSAARVSRSTRSRPCPRRPEIGSGPSLSATCGLCASLLLSSLESALTLSLPSRRYEAQQDGYDAEEKRAEIFHPNSRFLVLWPSPPPAPAAGGASRPTPLGYCIFRFDMEETASEDDDELCDVAYWCVSREAADRAGPSSDARAAP